MRKRSEPSERARVVVNLRVLPVLRLELDAAAQQNGRTLSSEIEARLAESLGHRPAAPDLRTLIREELEADRKRQSIDPSALIAMGRKDLARGPHYVEPFTALNAANPQGLYGAVAFTLNSADQSKPD